MRKLLLTGTALMGSIGLAAAQAPAPMPMGVLGVAGAPTTYLGGNNLNNADGSVPPPGPTVPTPGTMVVHLNGAIWGYAAFGGGSGFTGTGTGGNKLMGFQFIGYARLYPGMDAMATNGMRYGAIAEIRQNFIGQNYGSTTAGLNGAGANYSTSSSGASCASTLYFRREAIYVGSNQIGIFRLGQDDGPSSAFDNGITTWQFGTSAWNGDGPSNIPGNAQPNFPWWSGDGAEYTPSRLAYFSPRFAGFDFAASYAPNNGPNNASSCAVAAAGCLELTSNATGAFGGAGRPVNWIEIAGRYQGTIGPVGLYGEAFYSASGNTKNTVFNSEQFHGFNVGYIGLVGTIAGFSFGSSFLTGAYNNQLALEPKGGNAKNADAWIVGAEYVNGPFYVAASYYNYQYTGAWSPGTGAAGTSTAPVGQRYDDAFAAGAGYALAPGMQLYVEYLYGQSHQGNVNLINGGVIGSSVGNNVHIQSLIFGSRIKW
jgi:predicted porin